MASSEPQIPSSRFGAALQYFTASDGVLTEPGNASTERCFIVVPFAHFLRSAMFSCFDVDNVGAISVSLKAAATGGAKAGTLVGTAVSDAQLPTVADLLTSVAITLAAADTGTERAAGTVYHVTLTGNNAGDLIKGPMLTIGVEPSNRSRL